MREEGREGGMHTVGIMQPYFVPYIGYWQLLDAVDEFVIYDDVNFINRGWIHRNRVLINGEPRYYNLPCRKLSQNRLIRELTVNPDDGRRQENLKTLEINYKRAPFFYETCGLMERIFASEESSLALFLKESIQHICGYLGIGTRLLLSSEVEKDNALKGEEKIIDICKSLGADRYYNAIGGKELYHAGRFGDEDIELYFLKAQLQEYRQFGEDFVPGLSIIDVMMFNSAEEISRMLRQYTLET